MTVSIHTTSGWALVISPRQSMALPAQPRRQRGKVTAFPPSLCHSLPAHLCPSLRLFFCECCVSSSWPRKTCDFQPRIIPLLPSARFIPIGEGERESQTSHIFPCVSPSVSSVCMQTRPHTDDQQTPPVQSGPRAASVPSSRHNLPTVICSHASLIPLLAILGLFLLSCTYSIFPIHLLFPRSTLTYGTLANGIGNIIPAGLCYFVTVLSLLFLFLPGNQS